MTTATPLPTTTTTTTTTTTSSSSSTTTTTTATTTTTTTPSTTRVPHKQTTPTVTSTLKDQRYHLSPSPMHPLYQRFAPFLYQIPPAEWNCSKCMCCSTEVRYPRRGKFFRCELCDTVNVTSEKWIVGRVSGGDAYGRAVVNWRGGREEEVEEEVEERGKAEEWCSRRVSARFEQGLSPLVSNVPTPRTLPPHPSAAVSSSTHSPTRHHHPGSDPPSCTCHSVTAPKEPPRPSTKTPPTVPPSIDHVSIRFTDGQRGVSEFLFPFDFLPADVKESVWKERGDPGGVVPGDGRLGSGKGGTGTTAAVGLAEATGRVGSDRSNCNTKDKFIHHAPGLGNTLIGLDEKTPRRRTGERERHALKDHALEERNWALATLLHHDNPGRTSAPNALTAEFVQVLNDHARGCNNWELVEHHMARAFESWETVNRSFPVLDVCEACPVPRVGQVPTQTRKPEHDECVSLESQPSSRPPPLPSNPDPTTTPPPTTPPQPTPTQPNSKTDPRLSKPTKEPKKLILKPGQDFEAGKEEDEVVIWLEEGEEESDQDGTLSFEESLEVVGELQPEPPLTGPRFRSESAGSCDARNFAAGTGTNGGFDLTKTHQRSEGHSQPWSGDKRSPLASDSACSTIHAVPRPEPDQFKPSQLKMQGLPQRIRIEKPLVDDGRNYGALRAQVRFTSTRSSPPSLATNLAKPNFNGPNATTDAARLKNVTGQKASANSTGPWRARRPNQTLNLSRHRVVARLVHSGLDFNAVRRAWGIITGMPHTVLSAITKAIDRLLKCPGRRLVGIRDVYALLIILECPFLNSSRLERDPPMRLHHDILCRLFGLLSCLSNEIHHQLVSMFSQLPFEDFMRRLSLVNHFITFRLTAKTEVVSREDPTTPLVRARSTLPATAAPSPPSASPRVRTHRHTKRAGKQPDRRLSHSSPEAIPPLPSCMACRQAGSERDAFAVRQRASPRDSNLGRSGSEMVTARTSASHSMVGIAVDPDVAGPRLSSQDNPRSATGFTQWPAHCPTRGDAAEVASFSAAGPRSVSQEPSRLAATHFAGGSATYSDRLGAFFQDLLRQREQPSTSGVPPLSSDAPPNLSIPAERDYHSDWAIVAASRVMALLFAANNLCEAVSVSDFYNTAIDLGISLLADFELWERRCGKFTFCQYPFLISMAGKMQIIEFEARRQMYWKFKEAVIETTIMNERFATPFTTLRITRDHLVRDSLNQLSDEKLDLKKRLKIEFAGEEGVDAGGLTKEWLLLLVREMFAPKYGMWVYDSESNLCWFNPASLETSEEFFLVGVIVGLAVYHSTILDINLPLACYKKLLNMPVDLDDLEELRPAFAKGLRQLLDYDGPEDTIEDVFCVDFVGHYESFGDIVTVPLVPNGENVRVSHLNRNEYVQRYVEFVLVKSIARQFEPFKEGFYRVLQGNALSLFRPEEIEVLVRGNPEVDIGQLQAVAEYEGFNGEVAEPGPGAAGSVAIPQSRRTREAPPRHQRTVVRDVSSSSFRRNHRDGDGRESFGLLGVLCGRAQRDSALSRIQHEVEEDETLEKMYPGGELVEEASADGLASRFQDGLSLKHRPGGPDPLIVAFWEILGSFDETRKRAFLRFVTGTDRMPSTNIKFKVSCLGDQDTDRLPVAHTCFNQLGIYRYRDRAKLRAKLEQAILESEGFGIK